MKYKYIAQDELDIIDELIDNNKTNFKDPIEITIQITVERTRYNSVIKRRKTPIAEYIKDLFKPCK